MMMYKTGITVGVFDLFHVGHLNLLESCKAMCNYLRLCSPIVLLDPVALRRVGRRLNRTFHQERLEQPRCCGAVPFSTDFRR